MPLSWDCLTGPPADFSYNFRLILPKQTWQDCTMVKAVLNNTLSWRMRRLGGKISRETLNVIFKWESLILSIFPIWEPRWRALPRQGLDTWLHKWDCISGISRMLRIPAIKRPSLRKLSATFGGTRRSPPRLWSRPMPPTWLLSLDGQTDGLKIWRWSHLTWRNSWRS